MSLTLKKIKRLEAKAKQKTQKQNFQDESLVVPESWADFARLTKIRSGGNVINFNPYPYQEKLVDLMLGRSILVVKGRQLGCSEVVCNFMLWRAASNSGYLGVVFSKNQTDTSLLARRMRRMIEGVGLKTTTDNLQDIELTTGGRILFKNSKPDSARGIESVVDVFFDEFAFIESAKEIFDAIAPAQQMLGNKARAIVVSTPNGKSGHYWDLLSTGNGNRDIESICESASKGEIEPFQWWVDSGGWAKVIVHWRSHPIYGSNPNFLQEVHEKQKLSWETIKQEYDLSFQESETNYFSADIVRRCVRGELEEAQPKTIYFIGVDPAFGGDDYCCAVVLKYCENESFSVVAFYRKRRQTSEYNLYHIQELIDKYSFVICGVETNSGGKIYYEELLKNSGFAPKIYAIRTTNDSKPAMLDRLKLLLEREKLLIPPDCPLINELLSFRCKGDRLGAAQGAYDDFVMATCFALAAAAEENFL